MSVGTGMSLCCCSPTDLPGPDQKVPASHDGASSNRNPSLNSTVVQIYPINLYYNSFISVYLLISA